MEINNLQIVKPRLEEVFGLNNPDLFFHVEILQRKKEVPSTNKNSNIIKSYAVKSFEYLENKMKTEIIPICDNLNARAMINLNPKSFKRVTLSMLRKLSGYIEDDFYEGAIIKLFDSCTASSSIDKSLGIEKLWIVDLDIIDFNLGSKVMKITSSVSPEKGKTKVRYIVQSKKGTHILTIPFSLVEFEQAKTNKEFEDLKDLWQYVEIKRDCLTNLYIPQMRNDNI